MFPGMEPVDLAYAGVARQAAMIAAGELSARDLLEIYLERIQRLDPQLNAFRVVFRERARMEADQADARRKAEAVLQDKMKAVTGGLPLPPGLGL